MAIRFITAVGASEEELAEAERTLGVSFPAFYRRFLARYSGASCEGRVIVPMQGLGGDGDLSMVIPVNKIAQHKLAMEAPGRRWIPFAGDSLGNLYVIDRDRSDAVFFWDRTTDGEDDALAQVAPDFAAFLALLQPADPVEAP